GPAFLLPDGRAFFVGANGNTALYTPPADPTDPNAKGSWVAGPPILADNGQMLGAFDAPGCETMDGHVIFVAGPINASFPTPAVLFEYDPTPTPTSAVGTITQMSIPDRLSSQLGDTSAFKCSMLALPTGQVLLGDTGSRQMWVYTPNQLPQEAWKP